MHRKAVFAGVVSLLLSVNLAASSMPQPVQGELTADDSIQFHNLNVELLNDTQVLIDRVPVTPDGRFNFRSVSDGMYRLRVVTVWGEPVKEEFVTISPSIGNLTVRLKTVPSAAKVAGGSVSVRRLSHKPPKDAVKALKEGTKWAQRGDHKSALAHLERSIALDPEYFDAQFQLGGEKLMVGDPQGALDAYTKTLEIDPLYAPALVNRGIVLLHFKRLEEAEDSARKALSIADTESAHYVLGLSMAAQNEDIPAAIEHLKISQNRHPQAKKTVQYLESRFMRQASPAASLNQK